MSLCSEVPEGKAVPFTDMIARCFVFLCFDKTEQKWQQTLPRLFPVLFFLCAVDWTPHGAGHGRIGPEARKRVSASARSELATRETLRTE